MSFLNTEKKSLLSGTVAVPKEEGLDEARELVDFFQKTGVNFDDITLSMVPCKIPKEAQKDARKHGVLARLGYIVLLFIQHEKDEA